MPIAKIGMNFLDYSGENSRAEFYMNVAGTDYAAVIAEAAKGTAGSVAAEICGLTDCTCTISDIQALSTKYGDPAPVVKTAQRELGLLIIYTDSVTGKKYRMTIPGPKWATLGQAGTDMVDTSQALWTAFVTAFEAHAVSEVGNAVTVTSGRLVGRNR